MTGRDHPVATAPLGCARCRSSAPKKQFVSCSVCHLFLCAPRGLSAGSCAEARGCATCSKTFCRDHRPAPCSRCEAISCPECAGGYPFCWPCQRRARGEAFPGGVDRETAGRILKLELCLYLLKERLSVNRRRCVPLTCSAPTCVGQVVVRCNCRCDSARGLCAEHLIPIAGKDPYATFVCPACHKTATVVARCMPEDPVDVRFDAWERLPVDLEDFLARCRKQDYWVAAAQDE